MNTHKMDKLLKILWKLTKRPTRMGDNAGPVPTGEMDPGGSEDESDIEKYFLSDDELKEDLKTLLEMPLEFMDASSEEEVDEEQQQKERGDSVERQMEALFVEESEIKDSTENVRNDKEFDSISENEFDGPESGECDTSDGELPDSPKYVVTLPATPVVDLESVNGDSDGELKMEYVNRSAEYYNTVTQKIKVPAKQEREVIVANSVDMEKQNMNKVKKEKDLNKTKDKIVEKIKKEKRDKKYRVSETSAIDEEKKKELKMKKYLTKCLEYFFAMSNKKEPNKDPKEGTKPESKKVHSTERRRSRLKSTVEKVSKEKDTSPHSSVSSRNERVSMSSHSSEIDKLPQLGESKRRSVSLEKERKSSKKLRSKSKDLKEYKYKYRKYLQYLQAEREKCYTERLELQKKRRKQKRKRRKSESSSSDKSKEKPIVKPKPRPQFLSFPEFCESRELISPDKELLVKGPIKSKEENKDLVNKKDTKISIDSVAGTSSAQSQNIDAMDDDDRELFITYSDLVEQDKLKEKQLEGNSDKTGEIEEIDPELKSISVFTSVLFKGAADSEGIPFLQETPVPTPVHNEKTPKTKPTVSLSTGHDDLYDWNDDNLSQISQNSLSPSHSPAPKIHNKALLNYLENQKERLAYDNRTRKFALKKMKYSQSRSKSPRKERLKKRKKRRSSKSISISPPPRLKSPEIYKKRTSPPAYLKERWRDYPSPPGRKREHYEGPPRRRRRSRSRTRIRVSHRSRSSSEERLLTPPTRCYRSRSRSPPPKHIAPYSSRSPPLKPPTAKMGHTSAAEKRKLIKQENERAFASLRATIHKPLEMTPLAITFTPNGDNYDPIVKDNYDPVVMNEVPVMGRWPAVRYPPYRGTYPSQFTAPRPQYFYNSPYHQHI